MPNHIQNIVRFSGDSHLIRNLLEKVRSNGFPIGSIDFNKVIPMPESLNITAGSITDNGLKAYREFIGANLKGSMEDAEKTFRSKHPNITDEEWSAGKCAWNNMLKYGAPTWYEWSIQNWGTKWNAYSLSKEPSTSQLTFQTAWSAPHCVLKALSDQFPDITIEHSWADEDIGHNCGQQTYLAGEIIDSMIPDYGKQSIDLAADVLGYSPQEWGLYENAAGSEYVCCTEEMMVIEICGQTALFTNERLTVRDIPKGLFCYDLRHGDDGGDFVSMEPHVAVNHGGTVITNTPIDFGGRDFISFTEDSAPCFSGEFMNMAELLTFRQEQTHSADSQSLTLVSP